MTKAGRHKRTRQRGSRKSAKRKFVQPQNLQELRGIPKRRQELWGDIGQIVTGVREGGSLAHASRKFGRDPRAVQRWAGPALRKLRNGRWAAKKVDRLLRVLSVLTPDGLHEVGLNDSRQASVVGKHWIAVERYLATGEDLALRDFVGVYVTDATGTRFALPTELEEIDRFASAGVLSFESIYARTA
jgi:hypothetical protein